MIHYINEFAWIGRTGHLLVIIAFVSAILSFWSAWKYEQGLHEWKPLVVRAMWVHIAAVVLIIGGLFTMMLNHMYQYQYVWAHVSDDLPFRYIFSAFWEGQEGSFLLWMFWHLILSIVIWYKRDTYSIGVIGVIMCINAWISAMILGIQLPGSTAHIGSSPFLLLREVQQAPIFQNPNYITLLKGNGINPLLQNYWMTIHPPTLFLGFASCSVPFAYAITALYRKDYKAWLTVVLPWSLFGGAVLGLGILMGGAWAYEALSFGGYWAWDPVENMSLVPWLVLLAAIHTVLIAKSTSRNLGMVFILFIISFGLVLYSTFLTRSGVLGDTSVHAFTNLGLETLLLSFLGFFLIGGFALYVWRKKTIPGRNDEEPMLSREFWMFIGVLVLLLSTLLITFTTSVPFYNKIIDAFAKLTGNSWKALHRTAPLDPIAHYNKFQLWIGLLINCIACVGLFLQYKGSTSKEYIKKFLSFLGIHALIALGFTYLFSRWIPLPDWRLALLAWSAFLGISATLDYYFRILKRSITALGSFIAHSGFAIMILGIIASGIAKHHISSNTFVFQGLLDEEHILKNVILFKNQPMVIKGYEVTYLKDTIEGKMRRYTLRFDKLNDGKKSGTSFLVHPDILYDRTYSKVASSNPDTKRYLDHDVFTHIASLPIEKMDVKFAEQKEDTLKYKMYSIQLGDTIFTSQSFVTIESIERSTKISDYDPHPGDVVVDALCTMGDGNGKVQSGHTVIVLRKDQVLQFPYQFQEFKAKIRLSQEVLSQLFNARDLQKIQTVELANQDSVRIGNDVLTLLDISKEVQHPDYKAQTGDIAVALKFNLRSGAEAYQAAPVYLIRNNSAFGLMDAFWKKGLYLKCSKINPDNGKVTVDIFQSKLKIPFELAENVERSDYIVIESIVFPGINLFWSGSLLMLVGLGISAYRRRVQNRA